MAVRKIPQRKCAGCEQMKDKKQLIRIVRAPDGEISLDPTGKKSGRGVYICPRRECLDTAHKKRGLERGLKCPVPNEVYERLLEQLEDESE